MKKYILIFTISICGIQLLAQKEGVVFNFSFVIDEELIESLKVEDKSKKWFSKIGVSESMPEDLVDSIKKKTEAAFTEKLNMPVKMCIKKNKKGEEAVFQGTGANSFSGLPVNTFKGSKGICPAASNYITINCRITTSTFSIILAGRKKSKMKPSLHLTAKVFDADKNEVFSNEIEIKNFEKLRSYTDYYWPVEVTQSETLTPYDIYVIYLVGLADLMKQ